MIYMNMPTTCKSNIYMKYVSLIVISDTRGINFQLYFKFRNNVYIF